MAPKAYRALAPSVPSTDTAFSDDRSSNPPTPSIESLRRRKRSTNACEPCRLRKSRCIGGTPCSECIARETQCAPGLVEDGRRGRKRALTELSMKAEAFDIIISLIRSSDDDSLQDLMQLIRTDRPLVEVVDAAEEALRRNTIRTKSRARLRHAVISIASITDHPPIRVPASPWTSLIDDDEAVSHLVSVYFTWQSCCYPHIDRDIFVREMQSQDLTSQFCSPLLVNALLWVSCFYTDHPSAFEDSDDPSTRGTHFMNEALRLWNLQQGKMSLTYLQSFPCLISATVFFGKDRISALQANQSISFTHDYIKYVKKFTKQGRQEYTTPEFQRCYKAAIRGVFMVQAEVALAWMKPLELHVPTVDSPYDANDHATGTEWRPYPKLSPVRNFSSSTINEERFKLYCIASDLLPLILSGNVDDSPLPGHAILHPISKLDMLGRIETNLLAWYRELPEKARINIADSAAGDLFNLHLAYHGFCITTQSLFLRAMDDTNPAHATARAKIAWSARTMADLFLCIQRTLGLDYFGGGYFHAASLSAFNILDLLHEFDMSDTFHMMIVVMSNIARRWTLVRGVLKMIWIILQERNLAVNMDTSTVALLKLNAVQKWKPEDYKLFDLCAYPNYAAISEKGRDFVEIGELLQEYAAMNLEDRSADGMRRP